MEGEEHARDPGSGLRQQHAQALPRQQHGGEMKDQVEEVIAQRIAAAELRFSQNVK